MYAKGHTLVLVFCFSPAANVLSAVSDKLHSPSRGSNSQLDVDKEEVPLLIMVSLFLTTVCSGPGVGECSDSL